MTTTPYRIVRPAGPTPLLYDSPHSGRTYPADFAMGASLTELRRGEDAYVDELLSGAPRLGAMLLCAELPRCYIDVNRDESDIDVELLSEPWPGHLEPTEKSRRGLGLIRRYVVPGVLAQAAPLSVSRVLDRVERVYRPYHAALHGLIEEIIEAFGVVWHVDWHSMKSVGNAMTPDGPGAPRADFVVSDRKGESAAAHVTTLVVDTLRSFGYSVSVNDPYLGGTIVRRVGRPAAGVHSVQVEINRSLYLDEAAVEKHSGFAPLANDLDALTAILLREAQRTAPMPPPPRPR